MKLVVADDSRLALEIVRDLFEPTGVEVHTLDSAIGLSGMLRRVQPDVVVLDFNMPAIGGADAVATVRRLSPRTRVVLFSDDARAEAVAERHGATWVHKRHPERLVGAVMAAGTRPARASEGGPR